MARENLGVAKRLIKHMSNIQGFRAFIGLTTKNHTVSWGLEVLS